MIIFLLFLTILFLFLILTISAEELTDLARQLRMSDVAAFRKLFDIFNRPIHRFVSYKLADADTAEDITQEVFVKLWENRGDVQPERSIKSYLYTIANNLTLNHIRHSKIVRKHQENTRLISENLAESSPEQLLEQVEFDEAILSAINHLPEKSRIVFQLSRMENLSYKEIAARLDISIKTVESHIGKSLKLLRQALLDYSR